MAADKAGCGQSTSCRMRIAGLLVVLLLLYLQSCSAPDRGFRFSARYEATRSGYRIHVISKGYVRARDDIARTASAVVTFCPTGNSNGRPLRITLTSMPDQWIKMDCETLGVVSKDLNRRTSEGLLTTLLSRSGYDNLAPDELQGTAKVIVNSLAGPKGVILEGQIESLAVLHTDIEHGYELSKDKHRSTWIDSSEVRLCN